MFWFFIINYSYYIVSIPICQLCSQNYEIFFKAAWTPQLPSFNRLLAYANKPSDQDMNPFLRQIAHKSIFIAPF